MASFLTQHFVHFNDLNTKVALVDQEQEYTYAEVNTRINASAMRLLQGKADLEEERVAFFLPASVDYVVIMHAVWQAGGIALPLNVASAVRELEHYLSTAGVTRLITNDTYHASLIDLCDRLAINLVLVHDIISSSPTQFHLQLPALLPTRRAMILYTSGTTNKPKGVVTTHQNICAQITSLISAWAISSEDVIPLFLPLHHIHGIINILNCNLYAGGCVHLYPKFDLPLILDQVCAKTFNIFMAVPTVYVKILQYFDALMKPGANAELDDLSGQARVNMVCEGFKNMRLNISGSAACPVKLFEDWQKLTQQTLLERYGMTEIGMAISNPYIGERRSGAVGQPLPGVSVALFDPDTHQLISSENTPGEICVRGMNVFLEYWNNPTATADSYVFITPTPTATSTTTPALTSSSSRSNETPLPSVAVDNTNGKCNGNVNSYTLLSEVKPKAEELAWFSTGDMAVLDQGYYRIMGRSSIDIIKSGGYKLSALEIEGTLLTHSRIKEAAVVGVSDEVWGEAVKAYVVLTSSQPISVTGVTDAQTFTYVDLKCWCKDKMSSYKIPKYLSIVSELPRNAMGKVMKTQLK